MEYRYTVGGAIDPIEHEAMQMDVERASGETPGSAMGTGRGS